MKTTATEIQSLGTAHSLTVEIIVKLQEVLKDSPIACGYYLACSKRKGRGKKYMKVVDKIYLR